VRIERHEDAENALFTWSRAMRDKGSKTPAER
jgi:hypothetical protein